MKQILFKVKDPAGLHARPAGILVKKAKTFQSSIQLVRNDESVNAKQILGIMALAVKSGEEIALVIEGEDEEIAYQELETFLAENL